MESRKFKDAVEEMELIAVNERTAYKCSEGVWWRCHRSLVSDNLKLGGWKVMHSMGVEKGMEHTYTKPARISDGKLFYTPDNWLTHTGI